MWLPTRCTRAGGNIRYTTAGLLPSQRAGPSRQRGSSNRSQLRGPADSPDDSRPQDEPTNPIPPSNDRTPTTALRRGLKIVTFNMGSASHDKLEWVLQYLSEHDVDIMCIQEAKCEDYPSLITNQGTMILHSHPSTGTAGGLLTLIRVRWAATQLESHRR